MPKAAINGIELYYESHGEGQAVVFAHGAGGNHLSWWQQVPAFAPNYRCVTFDHRGWGASIEPANGPGRAAFVEDLKQLLDHLGLERAFLVAQSMGGRACLGFAVAYPERTLGLVLGDTTGGAVDPALTEVQQNTPPPPEGLLRMLSAGTLEQHPNRAFLYSQISGLNPPRPNAPASNASANNAPASNDGPTSADLVRQPVPTLLIVGEEDAIAPPAAMRALQGLMPHARLEVVSGAAHSTYFEQPAEFNRLVGDFFAQVLTGSAAVVADN